MEVAQFVTMIPRRTRLEEAVLRRNMGFRVSESRDRISDCHETYIRLLLRFTQLG